MQACFHNNYLFSNYFLEKEIPKLGENAEIQEAFLQVKEIYDKFADQELNEAQIEQNIVEPILKILGWDFLRQSRSKIQGTRKVPDYALFLNPEKKQKALKNPDKFWNFAQAILEVKKTNISFDVASRQNSPHFQIIYYLTWLKPEYGILTDGSRWRLYIKGANEGARTYYQISLQQALKSLECFKFFYLFFKKDAFRYQEKKHPVSLQNFQKQSELYARQLEDDLRNIIYNEWLEFIGKHIFRKTKQSPRTVFNTTLLLLFRLLFIAYAEARKILPLYENREYYQKYSLYGLLEQIRQEKNNFKQGELFNRIKTLFQIIDKGSPVLKIPPYNGGLFSSEKGFGTFFNQEKQILDSLELPNEITFPLLKMLFLHQDEIADFASLDTRRIGSVYEGLTEYTFKEAHEKILVIKADDKNEYLIPESLFSGKPENISKTYEKGTLYLVNHKGARKNTGTYYTPDEFVEFVIQETLNNTIEQILEQNPLSENPEENALLKKELASKLLEIKIIDPAMGSGHFLVATIRFLTKKIISLAVELNLSDIFDIITELRQKLQVSDSVSDNDLLQRVIAKNAIYGIDLNPLAVELAKLSVWLETTLPGAPLSFLSHHLKPGNSLIGEDLDDYLKKLKENFKQSLFFQNLVEAKLKQALKKLENIRKQKDTSADEVHQSAIELEKFNENIAPIKILLDLAVAEKHPRFKEQAAFFNPLNHKQDSFLLALLTRGTPEPGETLEIAGQNVPAEKLLELLKNIRKKLFPFHWKLEFPDAYEQQGFHCVIGNPPWEKVQPEEPMFFAQFEPNYRKLNKQQKRSLRSKVLQHPHINNQWTNYQQDIKDYATFLKKQFKHITGKAKTNLYKMFIAKAFQLLKPGGFFGFVIPGNFVNEKESNDLRKYLLENHTLTHLLQFENRKKQGGRFFPEVHPQFKIAVVLAQKGGKTNRISACFLQNSPEPLKNPESRIPYSIDLLKKLSPENLSFLELQSSKDIAILEKLYDKFPRLAAPKHLWKIDLQQGDLNLTVHRNFYYTDKQPGDLILYEGKMIEQYRSDLKEPKYFLSPENAKKLPKAKLQDGSFVWENFRAGYREIARNTDARTLIATILPKNSVSANTLFVENLLFPVTNAQRLFFIAYLNTFIADYVIRFMVSIHVLKSFLLRLPFPSLSSSSEFFKAVVERSGALICYREEFSELAEELGKDWRFYGVPLEKQRDRLYLRAEIDVIFARDIFGLTFGEYEHILSAVRTKSGKSKHTPAMNTLKARAKELW